MKANVKLLVALEDHTWYYETVEAQGNQLSMRQNSEALVGCQLREIGIDPVLVRAVEIIPLGMEKIDPPQEEAVIQAGNGVVLIAKERDRQKRTEGFDSAHDAQWTDEQLASAGAFYALPEKYGELLTFWQFAPEWNKKAKKSRIRQLMVAGAYIAAEIDRLLKVGP